MTKTYACCTHCIRDDEGNCIDAFDDHLTACVYCSGAIRNHPEEEA